MQGTLDDDLLRFNAESSLYSDNGILLNMLTGNDTGAGGVGDDTINGGLGDDVLAAIAGHHERWDGTGYPQGLRGEEIPHVARIVAIADVFDALTADRPYRAAMPVAKALAILWEGAGKSHDPACIEALERALTRAELAAA